MTKFMQACVLILLLPFHVYGCECSDTLSPEIDEFIFQTWKTATLDELSRQDREERYERLTKRLVDKAREANVPAAPLEQLARQCIQFEETYRRMPSGWDHKDKFANLMYFTDITRIIVPIHLRMIGYCHQFCPNG